MISFILIILFIFTALFLYKKGTFSVVTEVPDLQSRSNGTKYIPNWNVIATYSAIFILLLVQPYTLGIIEIGHAGLKVNLAGDQRGANNLKDVSGWVIYNSYSEELQEIPTDQKSVTYPKSTASAKGGFPCDVHPSFNYSVTRETAASMYSNLRGAYKEGGLKSIEEGWLKNAVVGAINDVTNRWNIETIFLERDKFEREITAETNKRIGKWFIISNLRTNMLPPAAISNRIKDKIAADAQVATNDAQRKAADSDKLRRMAIAQGDSAEVVIRAKGEAEAIKIKQKELTREYLELRRIEKWNGVNSQTILGSSSGTMINVK